MSILISFLVDEAFMAQNDAEIIATVSCCARLAYLNPLGCYDFQVLEANGVKNIHELSTMPSNDLVSTIKWDMALDKAMVARFYAPFLRAAIEKANKISRLPPTLASKEAPKNTHKRSRSAERRKEERRAEKKRRKAEDLSAKSDDGGADLATVLATLGAAIKPRPQMLSINTLDRMKALAIDGSFDLDQCPPQMAVRKLLTKATEQLKALGMIDYPFVNMDLREFLPGWCAEASMVLEENGTKDSGNHNGRTLDPVVWHLAWSRFALAAAMVGIMPMNTAVAHADEVYKLTLEGRTMGGRRLNLGTVYDEVCRRNWAESSQALWGQFCIVDAVNSPTERAKMRE